MTGVLNELRQAAVDLLNASGVRAVAAMEPEERRRWNCPVAAVSLSRMKCAPGGFRDYLGVRTGENGKTEELFGRAVELTLALDLYSPRTGGESACQQAVGALAEALIRRGVGGFSVEELDTEPIAFLSGEGLYHLPVKCLCKGWLTMAADDCDSFTDFEVKGRRE